jgi:hypothetical protein
VIFVPPGQLRRRLALSPLLGLGIALAACTGPNPFYGHTVPDAPARSPRAPLDARAPAPAPGMIAPAEIPIAVSQTDARPVEDAIPDGLADGGSAASPDAAPADAGLADDGPPAPPALLPVAHWRLDEATGKVAADATGHGNVGALAKGALWTPDVFPGARFANSAALKLDGIASSVEITVKTLPALAARKTISSWFWTAGGISIGRRNIVSLENSTAMASIQVGLDLGRLAVWRWSDGGLVVMRDQITSAGWHHVAYVYDGAEHRLYFDGALVDSSQLAALGAPVTSAHLGSFDGTSEMFQGRLDDVRIYDRALTPAQVRALATGETDLPRDPTPTF